MRATGLRLWMTHAQAVPQQRSRRASYGIAQALLRRYNLPRSSPADGCGLTDA